MADWVGCTLLSGRYQVVEKIGAGSMGFVYRARDDNLDTDVVIKVPRPALLGGGDVVARFAGEIRSLVHLSHPHIVKILDVGEHDGVPFVVMQYLPGGSLEDRREKDADGRFQTVPADELVPWLGDISKSLDFIHSEGFIHRDVKPGNILFDAHDNVYLSDFGIAKALGDQVDQQKSAELTAAGMAMGTPDYMAPELVMGHKADGRADQYALAVTVYELLCGRCPFSDPTATA